MGSKKGIELSVNFLVILIITLVLFGMSLYFINKFRDVGAGYERELDKYSVEQLRALSRDQSFALFPNSVKLGVGESEVVGVGVTNNEAAGPFALKVDVAGAYNLDGSVLDTPPNRDDWISYLGQAENIQSGDFKQFLIVVNPKSSGTVPPGIYEFNVCITRGFQPPKCADLSSSGGQKLYPKGIVKGLSVRIE
ncbi:hypothetical protein HY483_02235 [Candidatus Woesearchaeota archaeon]|nr:hypothetical protein [Candidatus Woesearchaeota archaeon]